MNAPAAAPPGLAARRAALDLLGEVLDRGRMLEAPVAGASAAERAEARGLADLVLRRMGQIDAVLAALVPRPPQSPVDHILRLMAAELLFAGTPPHAAVDLGVRLVKLSRGAERFAGLVNAVGRKLAQAGAAALAGQDAARLNTPAWLWRALVADWGADAARAIAEVHAQPAPHDLTLRNPADAAALAAELGGRVLPTGGVRLAGRPQLTALPGYASGAWWVQDAAASLPARLVPRPGGARVLDVCAAPGGKTLQLAAAGAQVRAVDVSERRLARLGENLARTGLAAEMTQADALIWAPEARYDAILLDAPCSATGTVRRHPDLPHRTAPGDLASLRALQARLLDRVWDWCAPGGVVVYCVCSLLRDEGEDQVAAFLARTPGARLAPVQAGDEGIPPECVAADGSLRTRPDTWADRGGLDGFYAARVTAR